jgi:CheY-like chemotaxis protein
MDARRTVLLVEDSSDDAFLFKRNLDALHRFEACLVGDGRSAIRFLETALTSGCLPHAIFVDLKLPAMSGLDLLEWLVVGGVPTPRRTRNTAG